MKTVLLLALIASLIGCGVETASTAATVATMQAKQAEDARNARDHIQDQINAAMANGQQRLKEQQ